MKPCLAACETISGTVVNDQRIGDLAGIKPSNRETQLDPLLKLASWHAMSLRPRDGSQRVLAICGYKFGDSHINIELGPGSARNRET